MPSSFVSVYKLTSCPSSVVPYAWDMGDDVRRTVDAPRTATLAGIISRRIKNTSAPRASAPCRRVLRAAEIPGGLLSARVEVGMVCPGKIPESGSRRFRRDISLRTGQHLVSNHELADRG